VRGKVWRVGAAPEAEGKREKGRELAYAPKAEISPGSSARPTPLDNPGNFLRARTTGWKVGG
jgi:hypothetical protein